MPFASGLRAKPFVSSEIGQQILFHAYQTNFQMKSFAPRLVLKQRKKVIVI